MKKWKYATKTIKYKNRTIDFIGYLKCWKVRQESQNSERCYYFLMDFTSLKKAKNWINKKG